MVQWGSSAISDRMIRSEWIIFHFKGMPITLLSANCFSKYICGHPCAANWWFQITSKSAVSQSFWGVGVRLFAFIIYKVFSNYGLKISLSLKLLSISLKILKTFGTRRRIHVAFLLLNIPKHFLKLYKNTAFYTDWCDALLWIYVS